jgi:lysozyme family protein
VADFLTALPRTLDYEGGYTLDPKDPGGETYKGIARNKNPQWSGWPLVDAAKRQDPAGFRSALDQDRGLMQQVKDFYKVNYWDRLAGDHLGDQDLANQLFDCAVNMGVGRSMRQLQRALNILRVSKGANLYAPLPVDGTMGAGCLAAVAAVLGQSGGSGVLLEALGILRGQAYIDIMEANPKLLLYARGWLKRVEFG